MDFLEELEEELNDIVTGEFSRRVVITSRETLQTIDTRGIFDETLETVEQDGSASITSRYSRVTLSALDFTFTPAQYDFVDVYSTDEATSERYKIHAYEPESEGAVVIPLVRDD